MQTIEELKKELEVQRVEYARVKMGQHQEQEEVDNKVTEVTSTDCIRALGFICGWGKYKGKPYREIYFEDPEYFRRTVVGGLNRVNSESFTAKCFTAICPRGLEVPNKRKRRAPLQIISPSELKIDDLENLPPIPLIRQ